MSKPIKVHHGVPERGNALTVLRTAARPLATQSYGVLDLRAIDSVDLRTIYYAIKRQRHVLLLSIAFFLALGLIFNASQTRLFTASTRVVLNQITDSVTPKKDNVQGDAPVQNSDGVDTEVEVIRSRNLATRVAQTLELERNSDFNPFLISHESVAHKALGGLGLLHPAKLPPAPTAAAIQRAVINTLLGSLLVQRVGSTFTFDISVTTPDANDAQRIADQFATEYTQLSLRDRRDRGAGTIDFLSRRLDVLRDQAETDTARAQQYRIANNLLSTTGASLTEQQISTYNGQVAIARAQAEEDAARLSTARAQLRAGSGGGDVGEALNSPVVSSLRAQRAEVSARLAALQAQFGPLYPTVQKTLGERNAVDAEISTEIRQVISNLEAKAKISSENLASIEGSLNSAHGELASNNRTMVGLDDLKRRAETSQQLYDSYLTKYKELVASQGTESPNARIISYADLPTSSVSPRSTLNIILALVIGGGIGVAVGLIREMMYSGLTTSSDVESRLHVQSLGNIPALRSVLPRERSPISAISKFPNSSFGEAFHALRRSIEYAFRSSPQVILITSALPREGKTTTSACLAQMSAKRGERVVLVDVDIKKRGASRLIPRKKGRPGLFEVLQKTASLDEALVQDSLSNAWALPIPTRVDDSDNLLTGKEMDDLIAQLRERFDFVILDAGPVLPVTDTRVLASKVDAVVMVARWRSTADHAVRAALRLLPLDNVPIAGVVLTLVDIRKQARFGYGDLGLYYKKYKNYYR